MALPNPTKKRRYPFKRHLKRKLRRIAFMLIGAAIFSGINYYKKHSDQEHTKSNGNNINLVE